MNKYITDIGLEVHIELATATKVFCGCSTKFGAKPNTQVCPVCTGMPGTLPVLNGKVVELAMAVGIATGCKINRINRFDRKNYYYPDNPQNYQITQLYTPICTEGHIDVKTDNQNKCVRINEIHIEEDAGKLIHDEKKGISLVDYNRAGVPLIELVTHPDMNSAEEVIEFLEKLRMTIIYLKASDCKLNEGSMRVDVNLSVRRKNEDRLGTRTEMKNLNSFKAIARAIENERARQIEIIENGGVVEMETRRWDDEKNCSLVMRSKEQAKDYRYFPEPDLPPVYIGEAWIERIKNSQPEFREQKIERYINEFDIPLYDAEIITTSVKLAQIFEEAANICGKPKSVSNWIITETLRLIKENNMEAEELSFSPSHLAGLVKLVEEGVINSTTAKMVFERIFSANVNPKEYVKEKGLIQNNDEDYIRAVVLEVLENNTSSVKDYKAGKDKAAGYLVGQVMKLTKGKANPKLVNEILMKELSKN